MDMMKEKEGIISLLKASFKKEIGNLSPKYV